MPIKGLLLIDGNAMGFRAHNQPKLTTGLMQTQAIYGSWNIMRGLISSHVGFKPIVFWDGRSWRYDHFPAYKADRDIDPKVKAERDAYKAQRPAIVRGLHALGISQRRADNLEADDLIAQTVHAAQGRIPMRIVTGDKDLLQLVGPNVCVYRIITKTRGMTETVVVTERNFEEHTGYATPIAFVQGKAMIGGEDGLDGVSGVGKSCAENLLREFSDVASALAQIEHSGEQAIPKSLSRFKKKLEAFAAADSEGRETFRRNFRLMWLGKGALPEAESPWKSDPELNIAALVKLCQELGFASILRDVDEWARPFAQNNHNAQKAA